MPSSLSPQWFYIGGRNGKGVLCSAGYLVVSGFVVYGRGSLNHGWEPLFSSVSISTQSNSDEGNIVLAHTVVYQSYVMCRWSMILFLWIEVGGLNSVAPLCFRKNPLATTCFRIEGIKEPRKHLCSPPLFWAPYCAHFGKACQLTPHSVMYLCDFSC